MWLQPTLCRSLDRPIHLNTIHGNYCHFAAFKFSVKLPVWYIATVVFITRKAVTRPFLSRGDYDAGTVAGDDSGSHEGDGVRGLA